MRAKLKPILLGAIIALLLVYAMPVWAMTATVAWDPITKYADGVDIPVGEPVYYEVLRATKADLSDAVKLTQANHTSTTLVDTSISPNKTYYYIVRGYQTPDNVGPNSDTVSFRTFPPGKTGKVVIVVST